MNRMKAWAKSVVGLVLIGSVFLITIFILAFDGRIFSGELRQRTPQGDVLSLMQVHHGKYEAFQPPSLKRWLVERLPLSPKKKFHQAMDLGAITTEWNTGDADKEALWCWLSLLPLKGPESLNTVTGYQVEITDSQGWVYRDLRYFTFFWQNLVPNMNVAAFQDFPRREPMLDLRVYSLNDGFLGSFRVENPAHIDASQSVEAPTLPQSRSLGQQTLRLEGVQVIDQAVPPFKDGKDLQPQWWIRPRWTLEGPSSAESNWKVIDMQLSDEDGNLSTSPNRLWYEPLMRPLSPYRSVWRWTLGFVDDRSQDFDPARHHVWESDTWTLPKQRGIRSIEAELELDGVGIRLVALAGPGSFRYTTAKETDTRNMRIAEFESEDETIPDSIWKREYSTATSSVRIQSSQPHVALEILDLGEHQRVSAQWVDASGTARDLMLNELNPDHPGIITKFRGPRVRNPKDHRREFVSTYVPLPEVASEQTGSLRIVVHQVQEITFEFKPDPAWFPSTETQ